jgi:Predicted ribosomal protein
MIKITVFKSEEIYKGFTLRGHARYAENGQDIVCAGISALVLNAINSIEAFTADKFEVKTKEKAGQIEFQFESEPSPNASLLIDSMILGIEKIKESYNNEYMKLTFEEV